MSERPIVCRTRVYTGAAFARLGAETDLRDGLHDLSRADGLLCFPGDRVDAELLAGAPGLRAISTCSVGYDHVDVAAAAARGIPVTNTPGVLTDATAELTFALILAAARRVLEGDRLVRAGRFSGFAHDLMTGVELAGATLGIYGAGRIGGAVAERAFAFGMRVLYANRSARPELDRRGAKRVELGELLEAGDIVSIHVPLTEQTRHRIGAAELAQMKPGAILINTARGAVVDERALVEALRRGRPAAAGLDVYEDEPALAPGLAELPNTVLLPHLGSATIRTRERMAELAVQGLLDVLAGREPRFCV